MKLNGESIFDVTTIVSIDNGTIYYDDLMRLLSADKWPECIEKNGYKIGVWISKHEGFNGQIRFWVEGENAYPILPLDGEYFIEQDPIYEIVKKQGIFSEDEIRLVDEGFKLINVPLSEGGIVKDDGV